MPTIIITITGLRRKRNPFKELVELSLGGNTNTNGAVGNIGEQLQPIQIKDDIDLINMFEEGIPCRSNLLSEDFRSFEALANRKSEVMVAYCKVNCLFTTLKLSL